MSVRVDAMTHRVGRTTFGRAFLTSRQRGRGINRPVMIGKIR